MDIVATWAADVQSEIEAQLRERSLKFIPSAHSPSFLLMSAYTKMGNAINHVAGAPSIHQHSLSALRHYKPSNITLCLYLIMIVVVFPVFLF